MGRATTFLPRPLGPWEESKGQISFNFNYKVNFKDLCLFSQMKDTKYNRQDFNSVTVVMPQGTDFGPLGVPRGSTIFFSNMVMWHIKSTGMMSRTEYK